MVARTDTQYDLGRTVKFAVGGAFLAIASFSSFIWIPVIAASSAIATLMGSGVWLIKRLCSLYDGCYPAEKDALEETGTELRLVRDEQAPVAPILRSPRDTEPVLPMPGFRPLKGGAGPGPAQVIENEGANESVGRENNEEKRARYRYGA